jgi:hypothetical protein
MADYFTAVYRLEPLFAAPDDVSVTAVGELKARMNYKIFLA